MTSCKDITKQEENKPIKVQVEFEFGDEEEVKDTIKNLKKARYDASCVIDLRIILSKYAK